MWSDQFSVTPIPKIFVVKVAFLQLESVSYQQGQSIDTLDVHSFSTEHAMHFGAIFKCSMVV